MEKRYRNEIIIIIIVSAICGTILCHIGHTEQCPCGTGSQTTEHLLQSCPIYEPLRKGIWPDHTPIARKLHGSLGDLRCTATLVEELFVGCLTFQQHASVSQGRMCSDNFTCCHTEIEVADQTFYLTQ